MVSNPIRLNKYPWVCSNHRQIYNRNRHFFSSTFCDLLCIFLRPEGAQHFQQNAVINRSYGVALKMNIFKIKLFINIIFISHQKFKNKNRWNISDWQFRIHNVPSPYLYRYYYTKLHIRFSGSTVNKHKLQKYTF